MSLDWFMTAAFKVLLRAAGLGLSTHAVVVAGCANGKWSAVALGVDGGGKTCVVAKYFGFVDFCPYINRSRKQTV